MTAKIVPFPGIMHGPPPPREETFVASLGMGLTKAALLAMLYQAHEHALADPGRPASETVLDLVAGELFGMPFAAVLDRWEGVLAVFNATEDGSQS